MSNAEGRSPSALPNLSLPLNLKGRCFVLCLKTKGVAPLHEATPRSLQNAFVLALLQCEPVASLLPFSLLSEISLYHLP